MIPEGQTPAEVADLIQDIIQGKKVCDVGCGGGSFMVALSQYAGEVIGIEENREWARVAADKGFDIMVANTFFYPLPEAEVYYLWSKDAMGVYLKAQWEGREGTVVFGKTVRPGTLAFIKSLNPETREVDGFEVYITQL